MSLQNQEIIAEFATESQEHLANIENELLAIEAGGANIDVELVNKVFRSVHSIKGASGFLGFARIGELSHGMENVLNLLRNGELVPNGAMVDVLLKAADALRNLVCNIDKSNEADVTGHLEALRGIIEGQAVPAAQATVDEVVEFEGPGGSRLRTTVLALNAQRRIGHRTYVLDLDLVSDVDEKGRTLLDFLRELGRFGELLDSQLPSEGWGGLDSALPSSIRFVALLGSILEEPELLATALGVETGRVNEARLVEQAAAADSVPAGSQTEPPPIESATAPPAPPVLNAAPPVQAPAASPAAHAVAEAPRPTISASPETSIRVSVGLLDHLMNLAGELVLGRNQLIQMIATRDQTGLDSVGSRLSQVTSELQEAIMQTRMQPIGSVFGKFPRVVRDLSAKLGKQCELQVEGKDVELDKSLLECIADPLTHLVRNSIDHGIELPQVRLAAGKSSVGRVVLKAFHQAGKVNISIHDDGRGMEAAKIKRKAVEKGLITAAQEREMSDRDGLRLIFLPGFSTAEQVTDVSGRGVGMDVVKTNIEKAGGSVEIDSRPGQGTSVRIRLPLTLAIVPSLVVRCCGQRYAIPQVNISELVRIKAGDAGRRIEQIHGAEVLRLRGNLLPLVRLENALAMVRPESRSEPRSEPGAQATGCGTGCGETAGQPARAETALNIIVVETGHLRYGLIVDGLQDSEEIVVKPLGSHLKGAPCLAGATILGDGRVALILDVSGIAGHCQLTIPHESALERNEHASSDTQGKELQSVLLFTNDPSEQFAIPMGLISRLERIRAAQMDSVGGQEVLQYRGSSLPLLVLERYVRAKPRTEQDTVYVVVFRVGRQEVGLLAPTLVDIRDIDSQLDIVTFREPGILGSAVVQERPTRLIDLVELVRLAKPEWLQEEITRNARHTSQRVLLAEDSGFFRKQIQDLLETEGYEVLANEDGAAAWQAMQTADPPVDLVVTDIEMPNLDGYGLTRQIRADSRFARTPIIAVTSLAGQEDMERGREAGVDEYQIKLDRDQLIEAVRRFLAMTRQAQPAAAAGRMS